MTAHYTDGRTEDVTRWAQYQSNDAEVADVADGGQVETRELAGQAAIMARYQGQVAVFRATVPLGVPIARTVRLPGGRTSIDAAALEAVEGARDRPLRALHRRRVHPPGVARHHRHPADGRRGQGVRRRPRPRQAGQARRPPARSARVRVVLRDQVGRHPPQQARRQPACTSAGRSASTTGSARTSPGTCPTTSSSGRSSPPAGRPRPSPPVQWYRRIKATDAFVDDTAQVFLGMRLQCAKCHHHPFEKWSQDDYYGFAAFFAPGRPQAVDARRSARAGRRGDLHRPDRLGHAPEDGQGDDPQGARRRGRPGRGGRRPAPEARRLDGRPENPFFARALVNRYWAHFFGRGIVEPMDDLRLTNPPSNPELLDALADDFVRSGYDLKHLVRTICTSRVYGLSSIPNEYNAKDKQSFARHYPKRLGAEVLLDAISQVTGVPTAFAGLPAGTRAIELPDESIASAFLDAFGRPKRDTACECERVSDASLGQSLMLLNSRRGPGQALARPAAGPRRWPRTRGPTRRRSTSSSGPPSAAPRRAARPPAPCDHLDRDARQEARGLRGHHLGPDQRQGVPVQRLDHRSNDMILMLQSPSPIRVFVSARRTPRRKSAPTGRSPTDLR